MQENDFLAELFEIRDNMASDADRKAFDSRFFPQMKNPVIQYGYNYFLGSFAVGRFTLGHWKVGIPKLIAGVIGLIGAGVSSWYAEDGLYSQDAEMMVFIGSLVSFPITIWVLVDYFLMPAATRRYNSALAKRIVDEAPVA